MPLLIIEFIFLAWCYLIHPYPSHILDIHFFCFILSRTNPVGMSESHYRPPGLCLFTTSPSHEWFIKSCITIMTHCLSLFLEERLSSVDKWLEFQNNTNISKDTWIISSAGYWPSRCCCVANVISLSLNIWTFFLMCPVTGRLLFAEIRDWNESSFSCSKKKTKLDKQHSRVFL